MSDSDIEIEVENQESNEIAEISKKGYQLLKDNQINDAIDCFTKILLLDEKNNYALVGIGDAARKRGNNREAIHYYQRCLTHHPGNNYALFGLADCYKALNQFHKAISIWEQYLSHDNNNITVLTRVADAYRKVFNFNLSKEIYLKVLELEENNPYAIIGLGHLYYDFKKYREALYYWEKMLQNADGNVDIRVLTSIGNCHRKLRSFDMGVTYFEMALQRESNNFYALFGLADCHRGMNRQDHSLIYWNQILDFDARNKVILTRAGDAYRSIGNLNRAQEYYERALDIEYDTYAVLGLALLAKTREKYDEAIDSLRQLIQHDPQNLRLLSELTDCYQKTGDKQKAADFLEEYQKSGLFKPGFNRLI